MVLNVTRGPHGDDDGVLVSGVFASVSGFHDFLSVLGGIRCSFVKPRDDSLAGLDASSIAGFATFVASGVPTVNACARGDGVTGVLGTAALRL